MEDLWEKTLCHLSEGNFTLLQEHLGGADGFHRHIVAWHSAGNFDTEPEALAEALSCACMLGRVETTRYLLDAGVDVYAGMKTWLAGPHYAVSGGHLEILNMLLERNIPLEVKNLYGGTVLGQALWSAVNEHKDTHADIIAALIRADASIEPGTLKWWNDQPVPSPATRSKVADALRNANIS